MNSNDSFGEIILVRDLAPMQLGHHLSITTRRCFLNSTGAANGLSWLCRLLVFSSIGFLISVNCACSQTAASAEAPAKPVVANTSLISLPMSEPIAATATQQITYEVGRVIRNSNEPHEVTVIISVDSQHFNRDDMVRLASQLKTDFPNAPILSGEILDDRNIADNYVPAGDMYRLFYKARRAFYSLNRKTGKEYIQFSTARGKPFNERRINLK